MPQEYLGAYRDLYLGVDCVCTPEISPSEFLKPFHPTRSCLC